MMSEPKIGILAENAEERRLVSSNERASHWKKWGPYLSESLQWSALKTGQLVIPAEISVRRSESNRELVLPSVWMALRSFWNPRPGQPSCA